MTAWLLGDFLNRIEVIISVFNKLVHVSVERLSHRQNKDSRIHSKHEALGLSRHKIRILAFGVHLEPKKGCADFFLACSTPSHAVLDSSLYEKQGRWPLCHLNANSRRSDTGVTRQDDTTRRTVWPTFEYVAFIAYCQ